MRRCAILLGLFSFFCLVSGLNATVTTRHYNFEGGSAGDAPNELIDITDTLLHENAEDFFGWGSHIWIEVSGVEARPLPAGTLDEAVDIAALAAPSLGLTEGQGRFVDVSDGSAFDSPAIGSQLAIQLDGSTRYDDFLSASGSRGVYIDPAALEDGEEVARNVNVSESFNLMTQAWVYPQENNGQKQTVWQAGAEQGSVNITEDGFWQFEDLGSVGVLNCTDDGAEVPYSCEEGELEFPVAFNEWTHLGVYRGGNGAQVFLNGEHVAGNINPSPPNHFGGFANQITIGGRDDGTNGFIGLIDDFKVQGEVSLGAHDMDFNAVPPTADGDFDGNGALDAADIDQLTQAVTNGDVSFDLDNDGAISQEDRRVWVEELMNTYFGDSNLDGEFNSSDFVAVFTAGEYEDGVAGNSSWAEGDWNGDGDFDSSDFVSAFSAGGYEIGPRQAAVVPEPTSISLVLLGLLSLFRVVRR